MTTRDLALALVTVGVLAAPAAGASSYDAALGLATFEAAWTIVDGTYPDTSFGGLDWAEVAATYRPRAEAAGSMDELRDVVRAMLDTLGASHFAILPSSWSADAGTRDLTGSPGIDFAFSPEREVVVTRSEAGASDAGVPLGARLVALDGSPVEDLLAEVDPALEFHRRRLEEWTTVYRALQGPVGEDLALVWRAADGGEHAVEVPRTEPPGEMFRLGYFPPFRSHTEARRVPLADGGSVGVIRFTSWALPAATGVDAAVDSLRDADGIVLDLRGNLGGLAPMVMGVSGHFFDERTLLGTIISRENEIELRANPRRVSPAGEPVVPFAGPVVVLVDQLSYSASEFFAGGMQATGRAAVVGRATLGGALAAAFDRLPNGDVLEHPVSDFLTATGTRIEGVGVHPDVPVPVDAFTTGRDADLDAALAWIQDQRRPE